MAEFDQSFLKSVELRLLRCTISGKLPLPPSSLSSSSRNSLAAVVDELVDAIERGEYAAALSSGAARLVFAFADSYDFEDSSASAAWFYSEVERSIDSFLCDGIAEEAWIRVLDPGDDLNTVYRVAVVLCLGVAALLAFIQQNVTGPSRKFSRFPLMFGQLGKDYAAEIGGEWDSWARAQITSVGCHLFGKISLLQYLEYAKMILLKIQDFSRTDIFSYSNAPKTTSWWLCRLILLQQRILDELSSSLYNLLQVFKNETILNFGEKSTVKQYWGTLLHDNEALTVASMLQLEAGIMEYQYGRIDSSRLHLRLAAEASGTDILVTGVLGYRTVHQVDAKPQLVLVSKAGQQVNGIRRPKAPPEVQNADLGILDSKREFGELDMDTVQCVNDVKRTTGLSQLQSDDLLSQNKMCLSDGDYECDILMAPRFVQDADSAIDKGEFAIVGKDVVLTAIQQAIVLAQCLHLQRSKRDDELSRWEMAPYIEAIDLQCQSNYIIRCSTDILRIRWESTRSRTKQRAFLMMDKLVEAVYESFPAANQRTQLCFAVYSPTIPATRKEYGELCLGCGMVGEALKIFEDLELWDNLIYCYRLLDKKAAAVDLINARLSDTPDDPKLWCSLGDVTNKDDYYKKALEVSNNKSARAMRSLARSAYNKGDYGASKSLWESAMAVNSLYPDGWFALGAAALKAQDIDRAVDGFTRAVQLDPENGEAWNNIACLHMINKKSKPAFIAFKEALKFRRNSWQLWENYSRVALDVGNFGQALEATKMVLDLSSNKRVDIELLNKVLTKVEENSLRFSDDTAKPQRIDESQKDSFSDSCKESENPELLLKERERDLLVPIIGSILQQVIKSGSDNGEIWGLYARWHKLKGNLSICSEALLKQIRSYQGTDMWNNIERFKKFAQASLLLCSVYMELASFNGSRRELFAAEMHLKNSVKQAINFSETEEYRDLQTCLDEIKKRLDARSNITQL